MLSPNNVPMFYAGMFMVALGCFIMLIAANGWLDPK